MSTNANAEFDKQNTETDDVVQGGDTVDNSYASGGNEPVPVMKDEEPVEQPNDRRNPDSDEALRKYPDVWLMWSSSSHQYHQLQLLQKQGLIC